MALQRALNDKVKLVGMDTVLTLIGYHGAMLPKARERLFYIISDPFLGANSSFYDFKYSNEGYLKAVCEAVNIDFDDYRDEYAHITKQASIIMSRKPPYLLIETDFIRSNEPVFALAFLEDKRRIKLPKELVLDSVVAVIKSAIKTVKDHFQVSAGTIEFWGNIKHYVLFIDNFGSVMLSTEGEILSINQRKDSHAKLLVKKHDLLSLIKQQ